MNFDGTIEERTLDSQNNIVWNRINKIEVLNAKDPNYKPKSKEVTFSKVDLNTKKELKGAKLKVVKGESKDGNEVAADAKTGDKLDWTSGTEVKKFTLGEGTYTMVATQAPTGYKEAEARTFRVTANSKVEIKSGNEWKVAADSKIQLVDDYAAKTKSVKFSKQDIEGKELKGAKIYLKGDNKDE